MANPNLTFGQVFRGMWGQVVVREVESVTCTGKVYSSHLRKLDSKGDVFTMYSVYDIERFLATNPDPQSYVLYESCPFEGRTSTVSHNAKAERSAIRGKHIRFDSSHYNIPDFEFSCSGWFGSNDFANHTRQSHRPQVGDIIIGIVSNNDGDPYFTKWFIPSPEFVKLWKWALLKESDPRVPMEIQLDTAKYWDWENLTAEEKLANLRQDYDRYDAYSVHNKDFWVVLYQMIRTNQPVQHQSIRSEKIYRVMLQYYPKGQFWDPQRIFDRNGDEWSWSDDDF